MQNDVEMVQFVRLAAEARIAWKEIRERYTTVPHSNVTCPAAKRSFLFEELYNCSRLAPVTTSIGAIYSHRDVRTMSRFPGNAFG